MIAGLGNHQVRLNQEPLDLDALAARFFTLFKTGPSDAVFVRGDKDLPFGDVAQVMDIARGAGVRRIGLMTR